MADYTLYMDESETFTKNNDKFFVMSGVIIKNNDYLQIENKLKQVKKTIWKNDPNCENYILHEKDISAISKHSKSNKSGTINPCYNIFKDNKNVTLLYNELSKLFKENNLVIIGVCLDKSQLYSCYQESKLNNQFTISIQLLIEHYCQFLIMNNATGDICYEAMQPEQNAQIQQRIYELKALGTLYYSSKTIQEHLNQIKFVSKKENYAGLQLADFVPNTLARYVAKLAPKNRDFAKNIRKKLYDGGRQEKYKFGLKVLS